MSGTEPQRVRRMSRLFLLSLPLLVFTIDFLVILISYLLLRLAMPDLLGDVGARPALSAASIALVKLPMTELFILVISRRAWIAMVTRGELLPHPKRKGWRRVVVKVRDHGMDVATCMVAALITFEHIIDPGQVQTWRLAVATAIVPSLLPLPLKGLARLVRWWWRSRSGYRPRHAAPSPPTAEAAEATFVHTST